MPPIILIVLRLEFIPHHEFTITTNTETHPRGVVPLFPLSQISSGLFTFTWRVVTGLGLIPMHGDRPE